jgi:NAD(P)-dependent dehydrogenase (short-subunit alcohol dehydrogenase family)
MARRFENKVAIITGGASGIGQSAALAFAEQGAKVVIADVQDGGETLSQISKAGGEGIFIKCDVSKDGDVKAMVEKTIQTYGRLDFGINNAGIEGVQIAMQDLAESDWDRTIAINLKGIWLCMKYEIPYILRQKNGAIVNTASIAGVVGFANMAAYVASKHGVAGLTKVAALELAETGVRVNAICPGVIHTPMVDRGLANPEMEKAYTAMIPMGRMGRPEEMAETILYLCSDSSSYVTGQVLIADGGWVAQ